jgi:hypothetical protein
MPLSCFNNTKVYPWFLYRMVQPVFSGMIFGKEMFGVKPIQSFILFVRLLTSLFSQLFKLKSFRICFISPYHKRPMLNFSNSLWCFKIWTYIQLRTVGLTYGDLLTFPPTEPINIWLATVKFTMVIIGCGSHHAKIREFFFWLLLKDILSTRALLRCKNMYLEDYSCVFCSLGFEEDLCHLFFHCPFAVSCWFILNLLVPNTSDLESLLQNFRIQLQIPFFMEVIITMCWAIWSIRNDAIFNGVAPSLHRCRLVFKWEFALVMQAGLQVGICLSYSKGKGKISPFHWSMVRRFYVTSLATSPCVIWLIFFLSFFVSWTNFCINCLFSINFQ